MAKTDTPSHFVPKNRYRLDTLQNHTQYLVLAAEGQCSTCFGPQRITSMCYVDYEEGGLFASSMNRLCWVSIDSAVLVMMDMTCSTPYNQPQQGRTSHSSSIIVVVVELYYYHSKPCQLLFLLWIEHGIFSVLRC